MTCQFINLKSCQVLRKWHSLWHLVLMGIVTAAYGQFLPSKLLDSMDFAVNVHASLLPKYRGGAPTIMPLSMVMQKRV